MAIERTKLANETALLAYIRTGLYFSVAGSTLGELIQTRFWNIMGIPLIIIGGLITVTGIIRFRRVKKVIDASRQNIGNSSEAFIRAVQGK